MIPEVTGVRAEPLKPRNIALLGSTGSIGQSTLRVVSAHKNVFRIIALAAGRNLERLIEQIKRFAPEIVSVERREDQEIVKRQFPSLKVFSGPEGLMESVLHPSVDTVVTAVNGTAPLEATLEAIQNHRRICLANKETMVAAGTLIRKLAAQSRSEIIPVDSEQSAIFQALRREPQTHVKRIILTASGGPLFGRDKREFSGITVAEALNHPTWSMGRKITLDSATLMNKALEIIEAHYLFQIPAERIEVVIHPQSIVHSLVEFVDSSTLAQLSVPDMTIPIRYSLTYPQRTTSGTSGLDLTGLKQLEFFAVDDQAFPSIRMAYEVLQQGQNAGAVFNAANEVAAEYFLEGRISFDRIFGVVADSLQNARYYDIHTRQDVEETIRETKELVIRRIEQKVLK